MVAIFLGTIDDVVCWSYILFLPKRHASVKNEESIRVVF